MKFFLTEGRWICSYSTTHTLVDILQCAQAWVESDSLGVKIYLDRKMWLKATRCQMGEGKLFIQHAACDFPTWHCQMIVCHFFDKDNLSKTFVSTYVGGQGEMEEW